MTGPSQASLEISFDVLWRHRFLDLLANPYLASSMIMYRHAIRSTVHLWPLLCPGVLTCRLFARNTFHTTAKKIVKSFLLDAAMALEELEASLLVFILALLLTKLNISAERRNYIVRRRTKEAKINTHD